MSSSVRALTTEYAGCRFRSRLEARWAVFFDHLGIGWQYEVQGYVIDGRPYLPDFRLQDGQHVEVKGAEHHLDRPFLRSAGVALGACSSSDPSRLRRRWIPTCRTSERSGTGRGPT